MNEDTTIELYSLKHRQDNSATSAVQKPDPYLPRDKKTEEELLKNLVLQSSEGNLNYLNFTYLEENRARYMYRAPGELELINRYCSAARDAASSNHHSGELLDETLQHCDRDQAELAAKGVAAMRYGTQPTQCGVAFDRTQAEYLTKVVLKNHKEYYPLWEQYLALHEGTHCTAANTRGQFMGPVENAKLSPDERLSLASYSEMHADAVALFTIVRDSMRGDWFDNVVPKVFAIANKSFKDMEIVTLPQYRTRTMWFDAFAANLKKLDREKIVNLSDEDIRTLAVKYTDQAMDKIEGNDKTRKTNFKAFNSISY